MEKMLIYTIIRGFAQEDHSSLDYAHAVVALIKIMSVNVNILSVILQILVATNHTVHNSLYQVV